MTVALALRLAFVFIGFPYLQPRMHLREDGDGYSQIAQQIREGRYTDVTRAPVYPAFVAGVGSRLDVKITQAILDTATGVLIFWLAGRNWWAAALWAIYPFAIWRVAFINKEVLLTFLSAGYVCLQLQAFRSGKWWLWVLAGLSLGVVNLCKPTSLFWPVIVVGIAAFEVHRRRAITGALVLTAIMLLVVAPWTIRNWRVTGGEFLPVGIEAGGKSAFVGNYPPSLGTWEGPYREKWEAAVDEIVAQNAGASTVQLDRAFYRATVKQIKSNPLKATELALRKCGRFWFFSSARREPVASMLIQGAYLALAMWGIRRVAPSWHIGLTLMVAMTLYHMAVHAVTYADSRYSLPVMPFVCVLAALAISGRMDSTPAQSKQNAGNLPGNHG